MVGEINYGILDTQAPAKVAGSFMSGYNEAQQRAQQNALAQQQMRHAETANQLGQYQLAQAKRSDEAQNALAESYRLSYNPKTLQLDENALIRNLAERGQGAKIPDVQSQMMKAQEQQLSAQKAKIEQSMQTFDVAARVMSGVKDQASYDQARQQLAQILGPDAAQRINPVYNPQEIESNKMKALTVQQQLAEQHKLIDQKLQERQFAWQQQNAALNRGQSERHFQATQNAPVYNAEAGGFIVKPTAQNPQGGVIPVAGKPNSAKATEDERKAAGWLSQADNAYKNMLSAISTDKSVLSPSLGETIAPESMKGAFQSAPRQQFIQASSSLSEALLRAATGAGVNRDEAKQKIDELTPKYLDKPEVKKQKLDAIPVYLESLRTRSGRAAPANYQIPTGKQSVGSLPSGWSVQEH